MKLKLTAVVFLFAFLMAESVPAQNADNLNMSGLVTDRATGEPLIGVSIVVKGTTQGVTSDANGKYSIFVARGGTLVDRKSVV